MDSPKKRLESEVKSALKAGEKEKLSTLRMLLASVKNETIRIGEEIDEARFVDLVRKSIKQRNDSAEQYRKGGRPESAEKEEWEATLLKGYLPQQVDESEIRTAIESLVADEGLSGMAAMGRIMGAMKARFGATADNATLSKIARETLSS